MMRSLVSIILLFFLSGVLFGVEPDEILPDAGLEKRARLISSELRCLVCRNENIDSSDSGLARDLRILVRERLILGESNEEIVNYIHARYGDFVLLRPKFSGYTIILWLMAPFSFLMGLILIYVRFFRKQQISQEYSIKPLSNHEKKMINQLLDE
tara:strand:- start:4860 stop:5324 length:465 start_codon:yes stop_codon:yes gene_type:complete